MFEEITMSLHKLNELSALFNKQTGTPGNEKIKKGISKAVEILEDAKAKQKKSKYFEEVSPLHTGISKSSQGRAITCDPGNVTAIEQSVQRIRKIEKVLLLVAVANPGGDYQYETLNGVHRHTACANLMKKKVLSDDFTYPAIVIPVSDYGVLHPVIILIQSALNDHSPRKPSNTCDMQKGMEVFRQTQNYDLNKQEKL